MSFRILMTVALVTATLIGSLASASAAMSFDAEGPARQDQADGTAASNRLMIVNGNSGKVIYDDGYDDLFCVTRRVIIGYDDNDRPVFKRTMHCR